MFDYFIVLLFGAVAKGDALRYKAPRALSHPAQKRGQYCILVAASSSPDSAASGALASAYRAPLCRAEEARPSDSMTHLRRAFGASAPKARRSALVYQQKMIKNKKTWNQFKLVKNNRKSIRI